MSQTNVNYWLHIWDVVSNGYYTHAKTLSAMIEEQARLTQLGYGDPLDGFLATALNAIKFEHDAVTEARHAQDAQRLIDGLTRTLEGLPYYAEADLSWSAIWQSYEGEFEQWIKAIQTYLSLGYEHPQEFVSYTSRSWRV